MWVWMNCLISFQLVIRQFPLIKKKWSNAYTQAKDTVGCKHPWQKCLGPDHGGHCLADLQRFIGFCRGYLTTGCLFTRVIEQSVEAEGDYKNQDTWTCILSSKYIGYFLLVEKTKPNIVFYYLVRDSAFVSNFNIFHCLIFKFLKFTITTYWFPL